MPLPARPPSPAEQPMLAQRLLRLAITGALRRENVKGGYGWDLRSPGAWPTAPEKLAALQVRCTSNGKRQWSPGQPAFTTTVIAEVEGKLAACNEIEAQDRIEAMAYVVENVLLSDYSLNIAVQAFESVDTVTEVTADGRSHYGAFRMTFTMSVPEVYPRPTPDTPETQWPVDPGPPTDIDTIRLEVDSANVVDRNGSYINADFPDSATPAPRTVGPDGRVEIGADITLP